MDAPSRSDYFSYNLARTSLQITGSVTLDDCDSIVATGSTEPSPKAGKPKPGADVAVTPFEMKSSFTVVSVTEADPNEQYRIDVSKLRSWTKQIDLAVARNPNKTLVSINGTITDQSGPTAMAALQAAVAIGGAIAVTPLSVMATASEVTSPELVTASKNDVLQTELTLDEKSLERTTTTKNTKVTVTMLEVMKSLGYSHAADFFEKDKKGAAIFVRELNQPGAPPPKFCSENVRKGLGKIAEAKRKFNDAKAKLSGKDDDAKLTELITNLQSSIKSINQRYALTRTFVVTWTPSRSDLPALPQDDTKRSAASTNYVIAHDIDLYGYLKQHDIWFTPEAFAYFDARAKSLGNATQHDGEEDAIIYQLTKPLTASLAIRAWTVGCGHGEQALHHLATCDWDKGKDQPSGLVYRDPALATLRLCRGTCPPSGQSDGHDLLGAPGSIVDTSADLAPPLTNLAIVQLGRVYEQPLRNVMFETSSVSLATGVDGSLTSVGTKDSSAAAAGFSSLGAAANAQMQATSSRNTAIGAQNAAAVANASYADTVNKAKADCLDQQAKIIKAGGTAVPCE